MSNNPAQTQEWQALQSHRDQMESTHMRQLFDDDPQRFDKFSLHVDGLFLDYSKHRLTKETIDLLCTLAQSQDLEKARDDMMAGKPINLSEKRAALHTALRAPESTEIFHDGKNIMRSIHETLTRMKALSDWFDQKSFNHIVNIGIGGSDLGPKLACNALKASARNNIDVHFISNIDATALTDTLNKIDPEKTLFIIASKTFSTQETITNAQAIKDWFLSRVDRDDLVRDHFVAVTGHQAAALEFGIQKDHIFPLENWIGGRYSLWSSIGLPLCLLVGFDAFQQLLAGAHRMDQHFSTAPLHQNMPILMALLTIWYRNFWDANSYAILPYDQKLAYFPAYLQQLEMESNGKSTTRDGNPIHDYKTGPIVFGDVGTNCQHAFCQLIHQGGDLIPCDFIGILNDETGYTNHHNLLLDNMLAQSQALMIGRTFDEADEQQEKTFEGNKPSNIILIEKLDTYHLGMLIALYEHKIFSQSVIWNINCFDQFGVELGKELSQNIETGHVTNSDSSTKGLLKLIQTKKS